MPKVFESQLVRVAGRDRQTVRFSIDGDAAEALAGDTILTAILTSRRSLRGFEFGPGRRAGFCLMGACQECFVAANGRRLRACTTPVTEGLVISSEVANA